MASLGGHKAQFHLFFGGNRFPSLLNDRKELAHVVGRRALNAALCAGELQEKRHKRAHLTHSSQNAVYLSRLLRGEVGHFQKFR